MRRAGTGLARRSGFRGYGGGAPAAWLPSALGSKMKLWLRGGTGITQVAGPKISVWADQSGNAHDYSQATDANRPTPTTINGVTCPMMANTGAVRLVGPAFTNQISAAAWHLFGCYRIDANGVTGRLWGSITETEGVFVRHNAAGSLLLAQKPAGAFDSVTSGVLVATSVYVVEASYDGTTLTLIVNGVTASVAAGGNVAVLTDLATLGQADASCGELIVCNASMSAGERSSARSYLVAKFGAVA